MLDKPFIGKTGSKKALKNLIIPIFAAVFCQCAYL